MKQILTSFLLLFSLTISAQTTVVTGPKKKPQTTAPAKPKQQAVQSKQSVNTVRSKQQMGAKNKQSAATKPKCAICGLNLSECNYNGNHPKCNTCGKWLSECEFMGNHPKCSTCGKWLSECEFMGNHPKCITCSKYIADCQYNGNHPQEVKTNTFTVKGVSFKMCYVRGGSFIMGAIQGDDSDLKSAHAVALNDFYVGQTEVTQALWQAIMGNNPSSIKGENRPVTAVTWNECQTFINRLNSMTGKHFRLPTEAEWEFAARGGNNSMNYIYSGSNNLEEVAWYSDNAKRKTHNVATKKANELGIYDMSGNVEEWCADWFSWEYYKSNETVNPTGPYNGSYKVVRGGNLADTDRRCRILIRGSRAPHATAALVLGLRLAMNP